MKKIWLMVMIFAMIFVINSAFAGTQICFDIPNTLVLPRVKAAYSWKYDYENSKKPGETLGAFVKRMMSKHQVNEVVDEYEAWLYHNNYTTTPLREPDPNNPGEYLEIE